MASWTDKQRRYVEEYCVDFNQTRAAIRAGYSENTAAAQASRLMRDPDIKQAIDQRLEELSMSSAEATKRHSDIARAKIGDFFYLAENEDGSYAMTLDREKVVNEGRALIKEISWDRNGNPKLKLYDAQAAQKTIMDAHGVFNHKREIEHSGDLDIKGVNFEDE